MLSSQYQQQSYTQQQAAIAMNTLLPTPPSSPPRVELLPVESTISLLENLVAFYHQERMWVYRTRAQLEMSLQDRDVTAATQDEEETTQEEPDSAEEGEEEEETLETTKWMKRKKAFGLKLEGISTTRGMPTVARGGVMKQRARSSMMQQPMSVSFANGSQTQTSGPQPTLILGAGGREPGVQILEMFERMMQARMESCERVTRMVRNASGGGSPGQIYSNMMPPPHGPVYGQSSFFMGAGMG